MLRTWLIVGIVISLAGLGSAQTPPAKDSLAPAKDGDLDGAGRRGKQVVIEMRVIEGRGIAAAKSPGVDLWGDQLGPGMKVLAEPIVATIFGRPVSVGLQGQQSFSYLVPLGEGRFEAKDTDPLELGMRFTLVVQPGDVESFELEQLEAELTALDGREAVAGLDLDVGKPIITTRSLKTSGRLKLGAARVIALPTGPNREAVLVLRVRPMGFTDVPDPSVPQPISRTHKAPSSRPAK
jgi:hypothetical protein